MLKPTRLLFLLILLIFSVSCGRAIIKYDYQPAYVSPSITDRLQHIEKAIAQGCFDKGWTPAKKEDRKINASIIVRGSHQITVLIEYDENGFGITPVSTNMKSAFGGVHGKYNQWVSNLHRQISKRIGQD